MAVTPKVFIHGTTMGTGLTTYYTAVNAKAIIDKFTIANYGTAAVAVNAYLLRTGVAAGNDQIVNVSKSIAVNETYTFPEIVGQQLEAGGSIAANISAASSGSIRASGREVT